MGRRAEAQSNADADQEQRLSDVEARQAQQAQAQAQQAPPAQASPSVMDQLNRLTTLHQQGSLSDDEFTAAKAKVLAG